MMMNYDHGEEGDCVGGDVRDNHDDTWGRGGSIMMMVEMLMIRKGKNWQKKAMTKNLKKKAMFEEEKEPPLNIFFVG